MCTLWLDLIHNVIFITDLFPLSDWFKFFDAGLGRLVAKTEEEYVKLALQLASDVSALGELRMTLRELMSKSPVCDGAKFTQGLESTYRNMWHRYCRGDVPATRHIESLKDQPPLSDKILVRFSEHKTSNVPEQNHQVQTKMNGVTPNLSLIPNNTSCEANGNC